MPVEWKMHEHNRSDASEFIKSPKGGDMGQSVNQDDRHAGGCACGAIRFKTTGAPKFVANCHCRDCRRCTGAAFSTWVGFKDEQINWTRQRATYESSTGVTRGYCKDCGTPLTYQGEKWAGETHLLIGVFNDPDSFTPAGSVFDDEALPWAKP